MFASESWDLQSWKRDRACVHACLCMCVCVCVEPRCGLGPNKHTLCPMINDACDNNDPYNASKNYEHVRLINLEVPMKYFHSNVGQ